MLSKAIPSVAIPKLSNWLKRMKKRRVVTQSVRCDRRVQIDIVVGVGGGNLGPQGLHLIPVGSIFTDRDSVKIGAPDKGCGGRAVRFIVVSPCA